MNQIISEKIDIFFTQYKKYSYKKGEILIRAGDNPSGIFYFKKGYVKQYAISQRGEEVVVNVFKPIAFFPMSWAMNETPNEYFFEVITDIEVWKAPREEVIAFIKDNPDVLYDLMRRVYKGTDGILTRMTYLMAGNAYARLVTELIIQAKRFGKKDETTVMLQISEKDLAAQSGMTRETVSREIHTLKAKGLVIFEKNILTVVDIQKLEEELAGGV
ncbi:MAG: Crp/Fnr family transcriptional regulator [Candidatus Levybacteria bacterium]|nr:Crp/Fnr family transcriptional regulator [Candidatus Levybacteria bacterium]